MSRRFPTPLLGIDRIESWAETCVSIVCRADEQLDKSDVVSLTRDQLRKPDSDDLYSESYVDRVVSMCVQIGVLRRTGDSITVWEFGRDWYQGDIDFETFLWYGIKRTWVLEGEFPEGIDGLRSIHRILGNADGPLDGGELRTILAEEYDYEFNEGGIRGYPTLLEKLGAVKEREDGYVISEPVDRWRGRFRNVDLLDAFEQWLKREGPHIEPPPDRVKRDLAKYYVYRESGGLGKHRQLYDTFRREYLDDTAYESDNSEPEVRRAEKYVDAERRRRDFRDRIRERFPALRDATLAGLSTEVLDRIVEADTVTEAERIRSAAGPGLARTDLERWASGPGESYAFDEEFTLYPWQREAADEWFEGPQSGHRAQSGIARVVTGAGKTVMALEVLRRWLADNPNGVVTVIVPTNVLMRQWLSELIETLNVPSEDIGWAGGGHKDSFADGYRVLVSIVNSAVRDDFLAETLAEAGIEDHLLIADECHRYTGDTFSNIFEYPRTASLGLSATPLSEPGADTADERTPEDELLLEELGPIYYELTYGEGIERDLIPEFKVRYVGFELTNAERGTYDHLTDQIVDAVSEIETRYGNRLYELEGGFSRNLKVISDSIDGPTPAIADFFRYTQQRRELIADAIGRQAITLALLRETIEADQKSIVFQERIDQLQQMVAPAEKRGRNVRTGEVSGSASERSRLHEQYPGLKTVDKELEGLFMDADYRPVMYHSGHRREVWNDFAVEWFGEDGFANVMLSVKALIEGVDVPNADVGIVRVSSGSVRQRIQTLGRVLRTGNDPSEASELYVLYARDTVDEKIFRDYDWDQQLSMADVTHLLWDPEGEWETGEWDETAVFSECVREADESEYPKRTHERPIPDPEDLAIGETYPGPRDGYRFSVTADGDPVEKGSGTRRIIEHGKAEQIATYVHEQKGGGTVIVNEANHALTLLDDEYVFVGIVSPEEFDYAESKSLIEKTDEEDVNDIIP